MSHDGRARAIEDLIATRPSFHGPGKSWALGEGPLRWIARHVGPAWRTIETGCGTSTALFALIGSDHTVVAPSPDEHDAALGWCRDRGFATDRVTSVVAHSQDALPHLPETPFDLALIDGAHSFPIPMLDWYYLAIRLKVGGHVLVDDMHVRAPRLLKEFLASEPERWVFVEQVGHAAIFRKTAHDLIPSNDFLGQPWSAPSMIHRVRRQMRARTRLRELAGRVRSR